MTRNARLPVLTFALFGLIGVNLLVRLGHDSFRGDEAFAVVFARQPVAEALAAERAFEPNPPIYFMVLKAWMQLAGSSEAAVRLPSVLAGWLAAALVYRGGRESLGRTSAVLGMAVFGAMPLVVWYGQDARAYSLLMAFVAALMVCGWRLATKRGARWVLVFGILSALALLTHYFAALFLVAYGLGLFAFSDWPARRRLIGAAGIAAVLFGSWLAYVAPLLAGQTKGWIPEQSLGQMLIRWLAGFSAGTTAPDWARWAGAGAVAFLLGMSVLRAKGQGSRGARYARERGSKGAGGNVERRPLKSRPIFGGAPRLTDGNVLLPFLSATFGVPLLLALLSIRSPLFVEQYLLPSAPPFALCIGVGLEAARSRGAGWRLLSVGAALPLALLILFGNYNLHFNPAYSKSPDWRGLADSLNARLGPEDVVIANTPDPALDLYLAPRSSVLIPSRLGVSPRDDFAPVFAAPREMWFLPASSPLWDADGAAEDHLALCCELLWDGSLNGFHIQQFATPSLSFSRRTILAERFEGGIELAGYHFVSTDSSRLALFWAVDDEQSADLTIFVHLNAPDGFQLAGYDHQPRGGWGLGPIVHDQIPLPLDPDLPAGSSLTVGLYHRDSGERVPLAGGGDEVRLPLPESGGGARRSLP